MNFIAIDFETANNCRSSICAVGLAIVENGKLVETAHFLVKPIPNVYNFYNTVIHGIDDSQTQNEKTFEQQWIDLQKYFNNKTVVAHNAAFDCSVLRATLDTYNLAYPNIDYHCTYRLAQKVLPLYRFSLDEVSDYFNIQLNHHHAESDAQASAIIALKLCEKYKADSLEELSTNLGFKVGKIISDTKTYTPFSKK